MLRGLKVYVDANPLIYALESPALFPALTREFLVPLQKSEVRAVTSVITLTEVLTGPIRSQDSALEQVYRSFLRPSDVLETWPVSNALAEAAARLRASHGFRTPDAIHLATCVASGCDLILTGDRALARAGVRLVTPDQL
jgi:predicted nucleic acid-binding protein